MVILPVSISREPLLNSCSAFRATSLSTSSPALRLYFFTAVAIRSSLACLASALSCTSCES